MNWKEFITGYKGKDMPKELKDFNWGAFLLTFIWGIKHKAWITLLAIPLIIYQLPLGINWILYTILQFYCGIKGNMWAYQVDWWMSPKDFRKKQAIWSGTAIAINILIPILLLTLAIRFIQKSPENPAEFIKNAQCTVAYNKLKKEFNNISLNSSTTSNDIANSFAKHFHNATASGSDVNFTIKSDGKNIDAYYINFERPNDEFCNILQRNCTITSSFILPPEMNFSTHCKFYFDFDRKFEPDEETTKALKKGFNILKYL